MPRPERQVGENMHGGYDFEHRQVGNRRQRMRIQLERAGPGPRALHVDVLETIVDELADTGRAIDMRNDLQQKFGFSGFTDLRMVECLVLEAHRSGGDALRAIVERADQCVLVDVKDGSAYFFGKPQISRPPEIGGSSFRYMAWM